MYESVFLDLDGTLTDPAPGITRCIRYALHGLGVAPPAADDLLWCIGPPLRYSLVRLVGEDRADRALELYRERFADVGIYENSIYDGVPGALDALREAGPRLFVASSKPRVYVTRILEHFSLAHFFTDAFGAELDGRRADKSELLRAALHSSGAAPTRSVMIGDRRHDVIGALDNRMRAIGVLYGYGSEAELLGAGVHRTISEPAELPRSLACHG